MEYSISNGNFFCIWLGLDLQIHIWILTQRQQLKTMDCTLYFSSYDKMKNSISILFLSLYDTIYIWIEKRIYINFLYCWCSCIKKILLNLSTCFSISVVNAFVACSQIVMRCLFNTSKFITKPCETDNTISICWNRNRLFRIGI